MFNNLSYTYWCNNTQTEETIMKMTILEDKVLSGITGGAPQDAAKVAICHNGRTINLSANAINAFNPASDKAGINSGHSIAKHGDSGGACPE